MAVPEQVHEALGEGGFSIVYRGVYGKQQDGAALQVCMYIISCHGSTYYGRRRAAGGAEATLTPTPTPTAAATLAPTLTPAQTQPLTRWR